jgi:hypothetical protein
MALTAARGIDPCDESVVMPDAVGAMRLRVPNRVPN